MSINYTEEQVNYMVKAYQTEPTRETVNALADELNKSVKSIIGKLSREGVYKKTVYKTKTGEDPITKKELVEHIAGILDINASGLRGLEKSPKADLKYLWNTLEEYEINGEEKHEGCYHLVWRE